MRSLHNVPGGSTVIRFLLASAAVSFIPPVNSTLPLPNPNWYIAVGSKFVRPNKEYVCAVTVCPGTNLPTNVTVELIGQIYTSGRYLQYNQSKVIQPYGTEIFKLQVGDVGRGTYDLSVRGIGGIDFLERKKLQLYKKAKNSLHIQTDKSVYKPGGKVQFRVVALDSDLKAYEHTNMNIRINDGNGNKVKEWPSVATRKGVWSGEIRLSAAPVLGDWYIHVNSEDFASASKQFKVAEFALPKFQVSLDVPENIMYTEPSVAAHITAKYTFGRAVKGEATITFKMPSSNQAIVKTVPIQGETTVDIPLQDQGHLTEGDLKLEVTVEEALTGVKLRTEGSVKIHMHQYQMEFIDKPIFFMPGVKQYMLDTIVALTALSKFAEKIGGRNPGDITVTFSTSTNRDFFSKDIVLDSEHSLDFHKLQIPGLVDTVEIHAKGKGLAVVQASYSYNVFPEEARPLFNLTAKVDFNNTSDQLLLNICSSFVSEGGEKSSNMAVMEIGLPSGFKFDQDSLPSLTSSRNVKRIEFENGDTLVILYFDKMTADEVCPQVSTVRIHKVERPKPAPIVVFDYYDQSRRASLFYSLPDVSDSTTTLSSTVPPV